MIRVLTVALAVATAAIATSASAHNGNGWFDTATATAADIIDRYPAVHEASCVPIPPGERVRYHAHSRVRGSTRVWDHFVCTLSLRDAHKCKSIAHVTGAEWWQFQLSTYPISGCTAIALERPRAVSGRPLFKDVSFGITFEYPKAFTLVRRVSFSKSSGAHPAARSALILANEDVITVS